MNVSKLFGWGSEEPPFLTSKEAGIPRLYTERHISSADHRYWVQFTTFFDSAEQVFNKLTVEDVRAAADQAPENLVTLVEVLTLHLESLLNDPNFAPVPPFNPGGFAALFKGPTPTPPVSARNRKREALNCCRVLTRVIPVLYETPSAVKADTDIFDLEQRALWDPKSRSGRGRSNSGPRSLVPSDTRSTDEKSNEDQFIIADADESMLSSGDPLSTGDDMSMLDVPMPITGHALLLTLMELLFHAGFTMPWTEEQLAINDSDVSRVHFTIWEAGIGCPVNLEGTTTEHVQRRIEVLRLLLVLLSKPMYIPADAQSTTEKHALRFVASELEKPVVLSFLCSMLNTVANYPQANAWVSDTQRDTHTSLCLQVISALLTYEAPDTPNLFQFYMSKLYRESDLQFLLSGDARMVRLGMSSTRGAFELSGVSSTFARPAEEHISLMLVVLWVLLRTNEHFVAFVTSDRVHSVQLLSWILYVALANKASLPTLGQAQLSIFLLHELSAHPKFCEHLATANSVDLVTVPPRFLRPHGSLAMDTLIEGVYQLVTTSSGKLTPLYPGLVFVLCNSAPFWHDLSVVSAARLEQLLLHFSSPKFLLSGADHPRVLNLLLDAFSRVVRSRYADNANVVYVLVRCAPTLERLRSFDLEAALNSVHRAWEHAHAALPPAVPLKDAPTPPTKQGAPKLAFRDGSQLPPETVPSHENESDNDIKDAAKMDTEASASKSDEASANLDEAKDTCSTHAPTIHDSDPLGAGESDAIVHESAPEKPAKNNSKPLPVTSEPLKDAGINAESSGTNTTEGHADTEADHASFHIDTENEKEASDTGTMPSGATDGENLSTKPSKSHTNTSLPTHKEATPSEQYTVGSAEPTREQRDYVARTLGKDGFVATSEWVESWGDTLDFTVLGPLLDSLVPRVNAYCADSKVTASGDAKVLAYVREQSLDVPQAPTPEYPICWTQQSNTWLLSYTWGLLFLAGVTPLSIWTDTHTCFFAVHFEPSQSTPVTDAIDAMSSLTSSLLAQLPFMPSQVQEANNPQPRSQAA